MNTPREFQAHYAETSGRDALANARATMQRALEELDRYIARYDEAESLKDKANVLNWTLSHLATYVPNNVRLDLIAGAQAELVRADTMELGTPSQAQKRSNRRVASISNSAVLRVAQRSTTRSQR